MRTFARYQGLVPADRCLRLVITLLALVALLGCGAETDKDLVMFLGDPIVSSEEGDGPGGSSGVHCNCTCYCDYCFFSAEVTCNPAGPSCSSCDAVCENGCRQSQCGSSTMAFGSCEELD